MSRRIYITFGGAAYDDSIERIVYDGHKYGADEVIVYDDRWLIKTGFVEQHKFIFESEPQHGFGFCSWKPFVILDAMSKALPGDVLLYTDADTYPVSDLSPLFEMCERDGIVLFEEQGCVNNRWIRRDCFIAMSCDEPRFHNGQHACGRFQLFENGWRSMTVVALWGDFATDPRCTLRGPGQAENLPTFHTHCTEQAVLSLLAMRGDIPLHRTPDQNGWPIQPGCGQAGDTYPQLFEQKWCAGDRSNLTGSRFFNVEPR